MMRGCEDPIYSSFIGPRIIAVSVIFRRHLHVRIRKLRLKRDVNVIRLHTVDEVQLHGKWYDGGIVLKVPAPTVPRCIIIIIIMCQTTTPIITWLQTKEFSVLLKPEQRNSFRDIKQNIQVRTNLDKFVFHIFPTGNRTQDLFIQCL